MSSVAEWSGIWADCFRTRQVVGGDFRNQMSVQVPIYPLLSDLDEPWQSPGFEGVLRHRQLREAKLSFQGGRSWNPRGEVIGPRLHSDMVGTPTHKAGGPTPRATLFLLCHVAPPLSLPGCDSWWELILGLCLPRNSLQQMSLSGFEEWGKDSKKWNVCKLRVVS